MALQKSQGPSLRLCLLVSKEVGGGSGQHSVLEGCLDRLGEVWHVCEFCVIVARRVYVEAVT